MSTVEAWAKFLTETSYKDIPSQAIEVALVHIADTIATTLAGASEPVGKIVAKYTREQGGSPEAGVFGTGFQTSAAAAAFANGVMGHCLDYDDTWVITGHPSVVVLPTVLALGEKLHVSGKAVLEAYVLALEIMGKLAINMGDLYRHAWHPTAIWGTMGACAAATKLLGLDVNRTRMAFGIGASAAAGLIKNLGTMTKSFHAGNANRNGVVAALLAKEGWTADLDIMDAKGFAAAMAGEGNFDLGKMAEDLGKPFSFMVPELGIAIKKYPCGFALHWAIDAALHLVKEHHISYREVDNIEVGVRPSEGFSNPSPATGLRAKFSIEYVVAAAVVDGEISRHSFDDDKVKDPKIRAMMGRITLKEYPLPAEFPTIRFYPVTITLKDGQKYSHRVDKPSGYPDVPITREQLLYKYRDCAAGILPPEKIEESIKHIEALADTDDISPLMHILAGSSEQT